MAVMFSANSLGFCGCLSWLRQLRSSDSSCLPLGGILSLRQDYVALSALCSLKHSFPGATQQLLQFGRPQLQNKLSVCFHSRNWLYVDDRPGRVKWGVLVRVWEKVLPISDMLNTNEAHHTIRPCLWLMS
jgi:hypothetical protein